MIKILLLLIKPLLAFKQVWSSAIQTRYVDSKDNYTFVFLNGLADLLRLKLLKL